MRRIIFIVFVLICGWVRAEEGSYAKALSIGNESTCQYVDEPSISSSDAINYGSLVSVDETRTPYRKYADDGVELSFFEIQSTDFRLFLLYSLTQDERFVLNVENELGVFIINSNDDMSGDDFFDSFEEFYNDTYADFQLLSKIDISNLIPVWKSNVVARHFVSIMMDHTLSQTRSGNDHCINADPFCTTDLYEFNAAYSNIEADENADFGCVSIPRNPSWYYMRIDNSGPFVIHMEGHNPNNPSSLLDIDFCMWGPFTQQQVESGYACSHLTTNKIIDCSYSTAGTEDAYLGYVESQHTSHYGSSLADGNITYHVPQAGEYYLLMITNYSNQACTINFNYASGTGTTDCDILPPILENGGPYCVGETIQLTANTTHNATYQWTGPNGFTSYDQNPVIQNCTMANAGPYICYIHVGSHSNFSSTQVVIYPNPVANFTATTVCQGQATQFTSTSTTIPSGSGSVYAITNYQWNFGDGQTGTGASTTHTYSHGGTYQVTLTVSTGNGQCTDQITRMVNVIPPLNVSITADPSTQICDGDSVTLTAHVNPVDLDFIAPGDILCTDNSIVKYADWPVSGKTPMGIVFYVNNTGAHGWAVSLNQSSSTTWGPTGLIGTAYTFWRDGIRNIGGAVNTQAIRAAGNSSTYPAAWYPDASQGWYLPAIGQLNVLFGELPAVNAGLSRVGGSQITDTASAPSTVGNVYLWSSTEKSASSAYALEVQDGQIGGINKGTSSGKVYVRAIIDF